MTTERKAPKRIAATVINSLKGGVVPRIGLPYITVGRKNEIAALLNDVDIVSEGGASFRFIVGKYGSGKSFMLQTIRTYVMDRGFVVVDADLSPERRLQGTKGQGLATYRELLRNMSTRTRPEGGAIMLVLDRWVRSLNEEIRETVKDNEALFEEEAQRRLNALMHTMNELVHGYDFAEMLKIYYLADRNQDEEKKALAVKWFRGEYNTKSEAKSELGVRNVISDDDWYDYLKLFALFLKEIGYSGLMILIDELVNIYKFPNSVTRQYNYEKILTMYNDTMQGKARYLGIIMSGTPQAVEDRRRGIYSYEALRSRLAEGKFSRDGARDLLAPVIRLEPLSAEEMLVLVGKLAELHERLYDYTCTLTDDDLAVFIKIEYGRIGADSAITPREVIRDFIELLDILYQHPDMNMEQLLNSDEFSFAKGSLEDSEEVPDVFAEFTV